MQTEGNVRRAFNPDTVHGNGKSCEESLLLEQNAAADLPSILESSIRPRVIGLIGLAIAVALCGFGYKLSLYHRHPKPSSRASEAKMWVERRNASVAAASILNAKGHLIPASQALLVPIQQPPRQNCAMACIFPVSTRDVAYFDFLIPFRSPPPNSFRLA